MSDRLTASGKNLSSSLVFFSFFEIYKVEKTKQFSGLVERLTLFTKSDVSNN